MSLVQELLDQARHAAKQAYVPYSKFKVGAAVLCEDGSIIPGCNIENASFGLTVCAERTALFSAIAQGKVPVRLAVTCPDAPEDSPSVHRMPCGACRQVMSELLPPNANIEIDGVGAMTIEDLLPLAFKL